MLLHAFIPASRANGPGLRSVVFFQGCSIGCHGCFNPGSHVFDPGAEVDNLVVAERVVQAHEEHGVEGVTLSGGEPMQQAPALLELIEILHRQLPSFSFGLFSGYSDLELVLGDYSIWGRDYSESDLRRLWEEIREHLDFAVLGRFNEYQPSGLPLRTSRSQALRMLTTRYGVKDWTVYARRLTKRWR